MRNLTKLKSLFILCLVICFLSSCTEKVEVIVTKEEKAAIEETKKKQNQQRVESSFHIITLDGCEYYKASGFGVGFMAHKGNCKNPIHNCR
jgi:hypothetical protein